MKKFYLGVGAILSAATPLIAAVSCSTESETPDEGNIHDVSNIPFNRDKNLVTGDINYLALGDSYSSGYESYLSDTDYFSYSDIFYNNLRLNSGDRNVTYRNLSHAGDTVLDLKDVVTRDPLTTQTVKRSNLISISIGANDLIRWIKLYGVPYDYIYPHFQRSTYDARGVDLGIDGVNGDVSEDVKTSQMSFAVMRAIMSAASGDFSGLISMDDNFKERGFELIENDLRDTLNTIHELNPSAQLVLTLPTNPFVGFPESARTNKDSNGMSIDDYFNKFLDIQRNISKQIGFVDIFDPSNDPELTERSTPNNKNVYFPNTYDIHPSQKGHSRIGNLMFESLKESLGIEGSQTTQLQTVDSTQPWFDYEPELMGANSNHEVASNMLYSTIMDSIFNADEQTRGLMQKFVNFFGIDSSLFDQIYSISDDISSHNDSVAATFYRMYDQYMNGHTVDLARAIADAGVVLESADEVNSVMDFLLDQRVKNIMTFIRLSFAVINENTNDIRGVIDEMVTSSVNDLLISQAGSALDSVSDEAQQLIQQLSDKLVSEKIVELKNYSDLASIIEGLDGVLHFVNQQSIDNAVEMYEIIFSHDEMINLFFGLLNVNAEDDNVSRLVNVFKSYDSDSLNELLSTSGDNLISTTIEELFK